MQQRIIKNGLIFRLRPFYLRKAIIQQATVYTDFGTV